MKRLLYTLALVCISAVAFAQPQSQTFVRVTSDTSKVNVNLFLQNVNSPQSRTGALIITGEPSSPDDIRFLHTSSSSASSSFGPTYQFYRSRGTALSPTTVNSNDFLGSIQFGGYTGSSYSSSSYSIIALSANGWGGSYNYGYLQFKPFSGNSIYMTRTGFLTIGGTIADTTYSLDVHGTAAITTTPESTNGTDSLMTKKSTGQVGAMAFTQGVYLPTDSASSNVDVVTLDSAFYTRVGDVVTVSGIFEIDPTTTATPTYFYMSVPINREENGDVFWVSGFANSYQFNEHGAITFESNTNRVIVQFLPTDVNSRFMNFSFQYKIR